MITRVMNGWNRRTAQGTARQAIHVTVALMAALALLGAAGCGGSSSKPAYCGDKTTLQNDVDALKSSLSSGDVSSLSSQVSTIKTDATTLASSAKSDFPSQTSAITTSVDSLTSAANALPSNPSASQIAALAVDAAQRPQLRQQLLRCDQLNLQLGPHPTAAMASPPRCHSWRALFADRHIRTGSFRK